MRFELIHPNAKVPTRGSEESAGYDLYCPESVTLPSKVVTKIPLGIKCQMVRGWVGLFKDRSSLGLAGLTVVGGVVDSDYRGEWQLCLLNTTDTDYIFSAGERPAQVVFVQHYAGPITIGSVNSTDRGEGGLGSTGR